jgi:hypothetical protein
VVRIRFARLANSEWNIRIVIIVQSFRSSACDLGEGVWIFKDASRDSGRTVLWQCGVETEERHVELAKEKRQGKRNENGNEQKENEKKRKNKGDRSYCTMWDC